MTDKAAGSAISDKVQQWIALDQYGPTLKEAKALLASGDEAAMRNSFASRISFGTAGLRGRMAAGWACMNDLIVIQASQGLAKYVQEKTGKEEFSVVVGYDARHNSKRYAMRAATCFLKAGANVILFNEIVPTPYVAFAVKYHQCDIGLMITASHNPKQDNGYKVYWSNGAQIISPHDKGISAAIQENLTPWDGVWDEVFPVGHERCKCTRKEIISEYNLAIRASSHLAEDVPRDTVTFTYTAMHGVGWQFAQLAFASFGLPRFVDVQEQVRPDPEFPTVEYPNPEEGKGALKLAMETADAHNSTVILAHDPDADRLAVACKHEGQWRIFNGNEIGSLFAFWLFTNYTKKNPAIEKSSLYMLASAVSSKMIGTMAKSEGFNFAETLTGFKWMGNLTADLEKQGKHVLFAYEEAIGFCVGTVVADKDGVSASVVMAELALSLAEQGKTLVDCLNDLYLQYGYHCSYGSYYICSEKALIDAIFARIRSFETDNGYPASVAGVDVAGVRDVTKGTDTSTKDGKCSLPQQSSHMITFTFANDCVLTLRTSGTEPKIKFYSEIKEKVTSTDDFVAVDETLHKFVDAAVSFLLEPEKHGLKGKAS